MNLTLANPSLLPLAALVTVPVLIHLFARARPRSVPFSSIRFIESIVRKTARIRQPRSWLILLLRTLLFAGLIGIFLKPLLLAPNPLAGEGERKNVILLIDASASMSAVEGSRTRFAAACARASEIVAGLGSGDLANIVWVRGGSVPEFPNLAVNKSALQQALQSARVSLETADLPGAFSRAEALLRGTRGAREIHVLSDFQAANWKGFSLPDLPGTRLVLIAAGSREVANQALIEILPSSHKVLVGEDVELTARVANYSSQPVLRRVFLRAGEMTQSRDVRLPPWNEGSVTFACRFAKPGEQAMEFTLDEDDFPSDNTRRLVLDVRPHLSVGIAGTDQETARRWARALESVDWILVTPVEPGEPPDTDVLMLAGWDGANRKALQTFLAEGGSVICAPAAGLPLGDVLALAGREAAGDAVFRTSSLQGTMGLRVANPGHPVFALFGGGDAGNPAGGKFSERLELSPGSWPDEGTLLAYQDGVPAVAEWGRVILWNVSLEKSEPRWAERAEFVPFLAELVLSGRRGPSAMAGGDFPSGSKISRDFPGDTLDEEVAITSPPGEIAVGRAGAGSPVFRSKSPLGPGLYEWLVHGSSAGYSTVNFPAAESDLRAQDLPAMAGPEVMTLAANESVSSLRKGIPLWPWLLGFACLCLLAESLVVWKARSAAP
ncbi:MAG: BatA and WFA domain-containing protein [Terrimicrobiaceae bacterium]|jgi:hypothetical protein|nr:BatA and WFA domain-containing protein [Terrimicrobiaceae bacterium]